MVGDGMILFFAWTDIQLINCLNTKCNYFGQEIADLVVDKRERISESLLRLVCDKDIFQNIYVIELSDFPWDIENAGRHGIKSVIYHMRYKEYFRKQLDSTIRGKEYKVFLVAAFWGETLNIYRYLKKYSKDIRVDIVEEGMADYDGPKDWVYRTAPASLVKSLLRGVFYCRNLGMAVRKKERHIYLYQPELSWTYRDRRVDKLPAIDEKNQTLYELFYKWQQGLDCNAYIKSKYIYIVDDPARNKNMYEALVGVLQEMPKEIRESSILKQHPLGSKVGGTDGIVSDKYGIRTDSRKIPIENILFQCNVDQKVLIVNRSSVLLYLKCMLNREPWVILTYKIPIFRGKEKTGRFVYFIKKLQGIYSNPGKIIIPNSLAEFRDALVMIENNQKFKEESENDKQRKIQ